MPAPLRPTWALLTALLLALAAATPAAAHTELLSTDPANGQNLSEPPERIVLRFGAELLPAGAQLRAVDQSGAQVELGPVQVRTTTMSADWPAAAADGTYQVAYRAVAHDGHPLQGSFSFQVSRGSPAAQSPSPAGAVSPTAGPGTSPQPQSDGGGPNLLLPALFLIVVGGIGVLVWRLRAD